MTGSTDDAQSGLVAQIESAFHDVPYPGDDHLVPKTPVSDRERQEIAHDFGGRDWHDLDVAYLRQRSEALFLLTPEAFRYYLPAYMRAAILDPVEADLVPAAVVMALTPSERDEGITSLVRARLRDLTPPQRRAVAATLRYFASALSDHFQGDEARVALERLGEE